MGVSQIELIFKDGEEQRKMEQKRTRAVDGHENEKKRLAETGGTEGMYETVNETMCCSV